MTARWTATVLLGLSLALCCLGTNTSRADFPFANLFQKDKPHRTHKPLHTDHSKMDSVERLAAEIDELEFHIETYGTIVPKHPNIWGQARLTKHRQEYEREIARRFSEEKFHAGLQGSLRRSDQSYLAMALSLNGLAQSSTTQTQASAAQQPVTNEALELLPSAAERQTAAAQFQSRQSVQLSRFGTGGTAESFISLEPVIEQDQLSRYLNHLNQLRRINEGDDTADSPGYSLNLVRIPISVLPGERTKKGYGAEITVTAEHHLTPEILPHTFRSLVIKDIVDHLAPAITHVLDDDKASSQLEKVAENVRKELIAKLRESNIKTAKEEAKEARENAKRQKSRAIDHFPTAPQESNQWQGITQQFEQLKTASDEDFTKRYQSVKDALESRANSGDSKTIAEEAQKILSKVWEAHTDVIERQNRVDVLDQEGIVAAQEVAEAKQAVATSSQVIVKVVSNSALSIPVTRNRRATHPFPPSQLAMIYGDEHLALLALATKRGLENTKLVRATGMYHLGDVASFLHDELGAVCQLLSIEPGLTTLWQYCDYELVRSIRANDIQQIKSRRDDEFLNQLPFQLMIDNPALTGEIQASGTENREPRIAIDFKTESTKTLAWGVIAVSALLNQRLMDDMRDVALAKDCTCGVEAGSWLDCYMPEPSPEANAAFYEYVRCRWPIHVFALDPVTQDQNIADVLALRRELQLAVAVAVATGQMGISSATQFSRTLEQDMETIQLNRTNISFSHGNDTFGWRFYPRFQTFPTVNNTRAFIQNIWGGPTSKIQRHELRLEAGMRECTAIVIMPSFIPYVEFHTRANWFNLNHPRDKELTLQDSVLLGRKHQNVQAGFQYIAGCNCYRPADIAELHRVVTQLDRRMPLQNMLAQVPHENTIGGFELFNTGVTDLAPELTGWYGAPGISPTKKDVCVDCDKSGTRLVGEKGDEQCAGTYCGTTMFLTGKGFSIHETKVIAGGRCVPFQLLSRQTMRVVIPAHVNVLKIDGRQCVDVHIATPYGVSNHLFIPVHAETEEKKTPTPKEFALVAPPLFHATLVRDAIDGTVDFTFHQSPSLPEFLRIVNQTGKPLPPEEGSLVLRLTAKKADDTAVKFRTTSGLSDHIDTAPVAVGMDGTALSVRFRLGQQEALEDAITKAIERNPPDNGDQPFTIFAVGFIRFDNWPVVPLDNPLTIAVDSFVKNRPTASGHARMDRLPQTEVMNQPQVQTAYPRTRSDLQFRLR